MAVENRFRIKQLTDIPTINIFIRNSRGNLQWRAVINIEESN